MHLRSDSFVPYQHLDARLAFGQHHPTDHFQFAGNRNPHLAWSDVPAGTKSLALVCWDPEVPTVGDDVNQEGRTVDVWLPRAPFFHWVVADLPAGLRSIAEGSHSSGVTPGGKDPGPTPDGGVQGANNYTQWFEGDADMGGLYCGYDGPAPPWNDERMHAYHFEVFALDVDSLGLPTGFDGPRLQAAMAGHVLDMARLTALYAINPDVKR